MNKAMGIISLLEDTEDKFDEFSTQNIYHKSKGYAGNVFIRFREGSKHSEVKSAYGLNVTGDTWFRKTEDYPHGTKGYGLAIKDIKITSQNSEPYGNYKAYKATMKYIDLNDDELVVSASIWLYIEKSYKLENVLNYINKNKHNWKP